VENNVATPSSNQPTVARREDVRPALPIANEDANTKPAKSASIAADSSKTYVVAKGDNPVSIAKKLKVSENDLLAVNHIDDPKKLQIGQKLIIPATKKPKAKSDGK